MLNKDNQKLVAAVRDKERQLTESEKSLVEYRQISKNLKYECLTLRTSIDKLTNQLIDNQSEIKTLSRKSEDQKEIINHLEDKNKELRQENETIARKRTRLEGQIAHMEKLVLA